MKLNTITICQAAVIAAIYVVLGILFMPISFGPIQCRISEMLTVLPAFFPAAIPGVTIGCLITNIIGGAVIPDVVFGTLATFIGAVLTYRLTRDEFTYAVSSSAENINLGLKFRLLASLPPVISNSIIVPFVLKYAYGLKDAIYFMAFTVGIGEIIGVVILGGILLTILSRGPVFAQLRKTGIAVN